MAKRAKQAKRQVDRWHNAALVLAVGAALLAAGCGAEESARLADYLDELEFDLPLETAAHVSIGRFDIPIAASREAAEASAFVEEVTQEGIVWMRLQFELNAETTPANEKPLVEANEKNRGAVYDAVLTVVRTSTLEELIDPRLAAVNARLSEAVRPLLGMQLARKLVLNDPKSVRAKRAAEAAKKKAHGGGHGHGEDGEAEHGDAHGGHGEAEHADAHDDAHHDGAHAADEPSEAAHSEHGGEEPSEHGDGGHETH